MASARQEKLQMRQRGAASRKPKEVDFGFSFGLGSPTPGHGTVFQHTQPSDTVDHQPQLSNSGLVNTRLPLPSGGRLPSHELAGSTQNRPQKSTQERRSIFEIPLDEPPGGIRSSKRRRIGSLNNDLRAPSDQEVLTGKHGYTVPDLGARRLSSGDLNTNDRDGGNVRDIENPKQKDSILLEKSDHRYRFVSNDNSRLSLEASQDQPASGNKHKNPAADDYISPRQIIQLKDTIVTAIVPSKSPPRRATQKSLVQNIGEDERTVSDHQITSDDNTPELSGEIQSKDRTPPEGAEDVQGASSQRRGQRPGGLSPLAVEVSNMVRAPGGNSIVPPERVSKHFSSRRRRRMGNNPKSNEAPTKVLSPGVSKLGNGRDREGIESAAVPNTEDMLQSQTELEEEKKHSSSRSRNLEQGKADQFQSEPDIMSRMSTHKASLPDQPTQKGHGRKPPKSGRTAAEAEDVREANSATGTASRTAKKTRSHGEAVPVTIYRFANVTSLTGAPEPSDSLASGESADELSIQQRTKLPSRGGVNPADVLGQVCRETLEKALIALKDMASDETHVARRAEHTRKVKAVEAYGVELEGRLFDLSEILDSNFALGTETKKAKREMMDLRKQLYHVRKERQEVAVQMDTVRHKYTEENSVRMSRSTINNTFYSLGLAVDRHQSRVEADGDDSRLEGSVSVGLEFKLRELAQLVSTKAPEANGGLLKQIKAFNTQLEAAAERL